MVTECKKIIITKPVISEQTKKNSNDFLFTTKGAAEAIVHTGTHI